MTRVSYVIAAAAAAVMITGPAAAQQPGGQRGVYGPSLLYAPGGPFGFGGSGWPSPYGYGAVPAYPAAPGYTYRAVPTYPAAPVVAPVYTIPPASHAVPAPARTYPFAPPSTTWVTPAPAADTGLRVSELADGPARVAGLKVGDVILSVGEMRTRTYPEIRNALAGVGEGASVEVEYRDAATGKSGRRAVIVRGGRIGATVEEVPATGTGR
jgi:hypothetical protein